MTNVILIGPQSVGKSTIGRLLASVRQQPFVDLSHEGQRYWLELDYDAEEARRQYNTRRFENAYRYLWPYRVHAVERAVQDHTHSIIELDPLQSVYEDHDLFKRVQLALKDEAAVILLRPADDVDESLDILHQREQVIYNGQDIIEYFVKHPLNQRLAKHVFYTHGKSPQQTMTEILATIDLSAPEIILIGPPDTGKSTLGELLADHLQRPRAPVDQLRRGYYEEVGYQEDVRQRIQRAEGFAGVVRYWKQFDLHAVERTLAEHPGHVIDFGAGHSIFDEPDRAERLQALLRPYPNVILLLPTPDPDESTAILHERRRTRIGIDGIELNRFLLESPCNRQLATHIVYTEHKSAEQTRDEILQFLSG